MLNKKKIRLMTKLAIYDKKYGVGDKKKNSFFKWDYIYFRNFWTRMGVLFGCFILTLFYILDKIVVKQIDITSLDLRGEATKIVFFTVLALVAYTILGTALAQNEFKASRERITGYVALLEKLNRLDEEPEYEHVLRKEASLPSYADKPELAYEPEPLYFEPEIEGIKPKTIYFDTEVFYNEEVKSSSGTDSNLKRTGSKKYTKKTEPNISFEAKTVRSEKARIRSKSIEELVKLKKLKEGRRDGSNSLYESYDSEEL